MNQKGNALKKVITEKIHGTEGMSSDRHLYLVQYRTYFELFHMFHTLYFP